MAPKNEKKKAMCLLTAWLEASNVKYSKPAAFGSDLQVRTRSGGTLEVSISQAANDNADPDAPVMCVSASAITAEDRDIGMYAIKSVFKAAGYGDKKLQQRPAMVLPEGRTRLYGEDFDLSVIRHNQFRQVPNPPSYVYKQFATVIKSCTQFFMNGNQDLCRRLGFSFNDLKTYAMLWTANFWGTGRVIWPEGDDNERLLYGYLRQRFAELYQQMNGCRTRNTLPDKSTVVAGLDLDYSKQTEDNESTTAVLVAIAPTIPSEEEVAGMEQYRAEHTELDIRTEIKRRKSASALLSKSLKAMHHDDMIAALENAAKSLLTCPETQKEARKHLKLHRADCVHCQPAASPVQEVTGYTLRIDKAANESTVGAGSKTA